MMYCTNSTSEVVHQRAIRLLVRVNARHVQGTLQRAISVCGLACACSAQHAYGFDCGIARLASSAPLRSSQGVLTACTTRSAGVELGVETECWLIMHVCECVLPNLK